MRDWFLIIVIVTLSSFATGCVHTSLYQGWGRQLTELPQHNGRADDVSLLLGTTPTRCELVAAPQPVIGVGFGSEKPVVNSVLPDSPADKAGLRPGDSIKSVNGQPVADSVQIRAALQSNAREGQPLQIESSRGPLVVVPKLPKAEQCYWNVEAGQVARAGGAAFVNPWGGSASSGGSAYQRFFRASCRVHDGFVVGCQANWQE